MIFDEMFNYCDGDKFRHFLLLQIYKFLIVFSKLLKAYCLPKSYFFFIPKIIVVFRTDLHKMKSKHRIIGEYATKRCFFSIRKHIYTKFITNLAELLENDEICIKYVVRIGKKKTSNKVDVPVDLLNGDVRLVDGESESNVHTKSRPMKVTFANTDVKKSCMKQLSKLKDVDESSPFKNISISHDMTKNERDQSKAMLEETKRLNTEEKSGKRRHIVRGPPWARKIIRVVAKSK